MTLVETHYLRHVCRWRGVLYDAALDRCVVRVVSFRESTDRDRRMQPLAHASLLIKRLRNET